MHACARTHSALADTHLRIRLGAFQADSAVGAQPIEREAFMLHSLLQMRKMSTSKKTISATPRQLESLIRLAEAHAKMRLSNVLPPCSGP